MTNSEARGTDELIDAILDALDQDCLAGEIDQPIDAAAVHFRFGRGAVQTQQELLNVTGAFVRHVYARGLRFARVLTEEQGRAEALNLLERCYSHNPHVSGFDAALADALEAGIQCVLQAIAAAIKHRERANHTAWEVRAHLARCSRSQLHGVALRLHQRLKPLLPPKLQNCEPLRLADQIPMLLSHELTRRQVGRNMLDARRVFGSM